MFKSIWEALILLTLGMLTEKHLLQETPMFSFWETRSHQSPFQKEMVFILTFWKKNKLDKIRKEKQVNDSIKSYIENINFKLSL